MLDIMLKISLFFIFGGIILAIIGGILLFISDCFVKKDIMKKYDINKNFIKNNPNDERVIAFKEAYSKYNNLTKEINNTKKEIEKINTNLLNKKKEITTTNNSYIKIGSSIKIDFTKMILIFHRNKEVKLDLITDIEIKTYQNTVTTTTSNTNQNGKTKRSVSSSIIRGGVGLALGGPLLGAAGVLTAKKKEASNISTNINTTTNINQIYNIEITTNDINNPFITLNYQLYNRDACLSDYNLLLLSLEQGINYNNEFKESISKIENDINEIEGDIKIQKELLESKRIEQRKILKGE